MGLGEMGLGEMGQNLLNILTGLARTVPGNMYVQLKVRSFNHLKILALLVGL